MQSGVLQPGLHRSVNGSKRRPSWNSASTVRVIKDWALFRRLCDSFQKSGPLAHEAPSSKTLAPHSPPSRSETQLSEAALTCRVRHPRLRSRRLRSHVNLAIDRIEKLWNYIIIIHNRT